MYEAANARAFINLRFKSLTFVNVGLEESSKQVFIGLQEPLQSLVNGGYQRVNIPIDETTQVSPSWGDNVLNPLRKRS